MNRVYQIKEYGSFVCEKNILGYVSLPQSTFLALEEFILTNQGMETDAVELMGISVRKGIGKIITAKNYVGVIKMKDGTTIEILPKIYSEEDDDRGNKTKQVLIQMLKTLRNTPYKTLQVSSVNMEKMNILEIFIRMYIEEVFLIVKKGLKCSYDSIEQNEHFMRGKLNFSKHIRINYAHKERTYVEYDVFTTNRPENRILKSTLIYLYKNSTSSKNRNDIKILLNSFGKIELSKDYKKDFSKCVLDRNMKDYETAILWSKVFLTGKSFTSFCGTGVAFALLFPMERLFESYVAARIRKELGNKDYFISIQDKRYHLFDEPDKKFLLKPDIVITKKLDKTCYIIDTKWKVLSEQKHNYGISQADMYQMYAYQKKYVAEKVILIYPKTEKMDTCQNLEFISEDGVKIEVKFVDLWVLSGGK